MASLPRVRRHRASKPQGPVRLLSLICGRCIADSVRAGSDIKVYYEVMGPTAEGMRVKITQPYGEDEDKAMEDGSASVIKQATEGNGGTYKMCFENTKRKEKKRVKVSEDTMARKPGAELQTDQKHLQQGADILQNAKTVASSLFTQMKETATSEEKGSEEDEKLRSRIITGSCFTIVVVVAASAWQLILLNKFFRSKKLI